MNDWRARADETFLAGMPARPRIVAEMLLLLAVVFAASAFVVSNVTAAVVLSLELVLAMALVRPWSAVHGGVAARAIAFVVVLLAVIAPAAVERPSFGETRRLGVSVLAGAGGTADVQSIAAGSPADGVLQVGDRIVAIGGATLDHNDPTTDLTRRTHSDDLPEDTKITVLRGDASRDLAVHVPKVRGSRAHFGRRIAAVRAFASQHLVVAAGIRGLLVIALLIVLVRANGQPVSSLGLLRRGVPRELLAAIWMTAGTFAVQFAVAIPVGLVGMATGTLNQENAHRSATLGAIAKQGSIPELALAALAAAAFEEIAFRGFLMPRLRALVGSWIAALVVVSLVFGAAHIYEGPLATIQTACLGAFFGAMVLLRRNVTSPLLAHAAFDVIMLVVIRILASSDILERLRAMSAH